MQLLFSVLAITTAAQAYSLGSAGWDAAYSKAERALNKLNQTEKIGIVTGVTWEGGPCVGNTYSAESIGYPSLCMQDSPLGVRDANPVTAFPAGINAGATWDRSLMYARGAAIGAESKGLGVNVQLGPVAGPLGKNPDGGRIWEGFSVDPYLSGVAMEETIQGMQNSGVQACAKVCNTFYYVLNDFPDQMDSTGLAMSKNTTETRSALTLAIVRRMSCMSGHS